jgi:hypothetical protein
MTRVSESFFHGRMGSTLGLLLFFIGLLRYRSYENQAVLGRWSYPFSVLILVTGLLLLVGIARSWKARQRQVSNSVKLGSVLVDFAILSWGCAYVWDAIQASDNGNRIATLELFGSIMPAPAFLEWLALVLLSLAAANSMWKNRNCKWSKVGLTIWPIVLLVLMIEGAVRLVTFVAPTTSGFPTYSSTLWWKKYVHLNREKFRDQEHTVEREANIRRLLVVGDSFAFGQGVNRVEDRFGEQLAKKLTERTAESWEAINASIGGTNTLDHIKFIESMQAYQPNLVILLYVNNDINYLEDKATTPRRDRPYLFQVIRSAASVNSGLGLGRVDPIRILYLNSYLFQEVFVRIRSILYNFSYFEENENEKTNLLKDRAILTEHLSDISRFVSIAAQTGGVVAVVPFDISITVKADYLHRYTDFVNEALSFGISIWPVERAFMGYDFTQLTVNKLDGHPNELANHLLAELVAERALQDLHNRVEK